MLSLKKLMTIVALTTTAFAAPGALSPAEPTATDVIVVDGLPINVNKTMSLNDDHDLASCEISCHPWYRFCQGGSYKYGCKDDGSFKFGRYHPGCHRQCMCSCDSQ